MTACKHVMNSKKKIRELKLYIKKWGLRMRENVGIEVASGEYIGFVDSDVIILNLCMRSY